MKIAVFGTGAVGETIGTKLIALGHSVVMGSRTADNAKGVAWAKGAGPAASIATFAQAAAEAELLFLCVSGKGVLESLGSCAPDSLAGKVLVDVTNPLDFSRGFPPTLTTGGGEDSIAEQVQRAHPQLKVVKTLNTVTAAVMVDPAKAGQDHDVFVSGNDAGAKADVTKLLGTFGWSRVIDLGDVTTARGAEAYVLLWVRMWGAFKDANFNIRVVRPG